MAVPAHVLAIWEGVYGTAAAPIERWSFSLKINDTTAPLDDTASDLLATALKDAYLTNWGDQYPSAVVLTKTKFVHVDGLGKTVLRADGSYAQGVWEGSQPGTLTLSAPNNVFYPLQTALCVSLTTARSGPTGKGRFYMPAPHYALATDYRLSTTTTAFLAGKARDFVDDVNLVAGPVSVMSSKGYGSAVTGVRVGRVLDTMRSRRGDLVEGYATATVT